MAEQRVQRRLAAILAADVVGYGRLMGADEAGTRARFNDQLDEIVLPGVDRHRGRLVKTMGDGFLVEFASVVDAVQCATDIQNGVAIRQYGEPDERKMIFRIGIHLGDVIVEGDDIHGEGVNVAARLEEIAAPGGICVSGMVHEGVRNKIAVGFVDLGERSLKNIADPFQVFGVAAGASANESTDPSDAIFSRPAVAVLPFENLSGDPEQEYFADGLTEDVITALSLWRSFPVIARNSTFAYKGQSPDIRKVGADLGSRYVIEGSVRKAGNRVRVTAQLIDAETGHHVWAEKYDRDIDDIFALQDELTNRIAAIVAPELERAENNRLTGKRPLSLEAWECVQRGTTHLDEYTREGNVRARAMFARAVEIDPSYGPAFAGTSLSFNRDLLMRYAESRDEAANGAMEAARRAVALGPSDALAHSVLGMALIWAGQEDDAVLSLRRSVDLNPSNGYARASLGTVLDIMGRSEEGISMMEDGLRLNPHAPNVNHINSFLARAHLNARHYDEALEWARKAVNQQPDYPNPHYMLALCLARLDRTEEARAALDRCERLQPGFVAERADWRPYRDPAANEHLLEGLRNVEWNA